MTPPDGTPLRGDDGEAGAGMVILRMPQREGIKCKIVVIGLVGGKKTGGDRFRRVRDAVRV